MPKVDRRGFVAGAGLLSAGVGHILPAAAATSDKAAVVGLRVSGRHEPIGLGDAAPSLSWRIEGSGPLHQSAYRILVSSNPQMLARNRGDVWDSGRIEGASSSVPFAGRKLRPAEQLFWKVQVIDSDGHSVWSEPSQWEMGLLHPSDWSGVWLAVEDENERGDRLAAPRWVEGASPSPTQPRSFRLSFQSGARRGLLTLVADGAISGLRLDGNPLEFPARDPNAFGGAPAARVDLQLTPGEHVLTLEVAPIAGFFTKPTVALAAQLRLVEVAAVRRISDGWETRIGVDAPWINASAAERQPVFPWPPTPARLLRRGFLRNGVVGRARLHVASLGGYRLWLNGTRIGDDELQSEPADYDRRIPCRSYDVTHLLREGSNVLGALVGDGFFASYQAPEGRFAYESAPRRIRIVLEIEGAGGEVQRVVSNKEWRHSISPLLMSELYAGEDQDLRLWPDGWLEPGFDASAWSEVWEAPTPSAICSPAEAEPIRIVRKLPPASIRKLAEDRFLIDFGQNFAGRVRLHVNGEAGQQIRVQHAEVLDGHGSPDRRNLRAARAEDRYILRGDPAGERLEPMLTYQGFRYAEVEGTADLKADAISGLVLSSALDETGTFRIDNPRLQRLWLNILWSQRSNFLGIPTDCPQRDERLGWTGDAQVFWNAAAFNMDVGAFTRSYCRILRDVQGQNGAYPLWAPSPSGLGWGTTSATPGWADAGIMLPYVTFLHNGDVAIVEENWEAMTAYLKGVIATNPDGLWEKDRGADLGDWLALDAKSPMDETTPKTLIATAMLARSIDQVAKMAAWTGRDAEAAHWREAHGRVRSAFQRKFVKTDGTVGNGSQCSFIMALTLGLLTPTQHAAAGKLLAADIRQRGSLLSTGFLGTPLALDALASVGEEKLAWDLLLRNQYPSWGYMVERGATTIWERWNGDTGDVAMNSFNHYALGAVAAFLYRRVAGIEPTEPGFARFRVAALPDERIPSAGATLDTVRGRIETRWSRAAGRVSLEVSVPGNCIATVALPDGEAEAGPGRHRFSY